MEQNHRQRRLASPVRVQGTLSSEYQYPRSLQRSWKYYQYTAGTRVYDKNPTERGIDTPRLQRST